MELEFKHCSLQQHMKHCYLESSRRVARQSSLAKVISSLVAAVHFVSQVSGALLDMAFLFFTEVFTPDPVCSIVDIIPVHMQEALQR
ncbi:hypothetical protein JOB18_010196 [Solea senegalensis]|uniref:Uncharacterized protein n=1 Tax=Solea senegalensis TaxID=28829 RepID=A0AAV6S257_SOLSE|nr:hypothetical protein JOB18_010196 [Solea senegalensis]